MSFDQPPQVSGHAQNEAALNAWNQKFNGNRVVRLARDEAEPFIPGRRLGGGGIGIVHETYLEGTTLALKRTYTKRLTDYYLNEINILSSITEKRHKHVVQLIGSYIHRLKWHYELGLLIWPVAQCDLAAFLQDFDLIGDWVEGPLPKTRTEDLDSAIENLAAVTGSHQARILNSELQEGVRALLVKAGVKLSSTFGCTANAVAWIHHQGIRHKDLKPSQILLSADGMWLTDFGWSKDVSELTQSATDGGENITAKYQAPERALKQYCGRPEDVFALGCTFFEMAFQLGKLSLLSADRSMPWKQKGWLFQANIGEVERLLRVLKAVVEDLRLGNRLIDAILRMIAWKPADRPSLDEVLDALSYGDFFGKCCLPEIRNEKPSKTHTPGKSASAENQSVSVNSGVLDNETKEFLASEGWAMQPCDSGDDSDDDEDSSMADFINDLDEDGGTSEHGEDDGNKTEHGVELNFDFSGFDDLLSDDSDEERMSLPEDSEPLLPVDEGIDHNDFDASDNLQRLELTENRDDSQATRTQRTPRREYDPRIASIFAAHQRALGDGNEELISIGDDRNSNTRMANTPLPAQLPTASPFGMKNFADHSPLQSLNPWGMPWAELPSHKPTQPMPRRQLRQRSSKELLRASQESHSIPVTTRRQFEPTRSLRRRGSAQRPLRELIRAGQENASPPVLTTYHSGLTHEEIIVRARDYMNERIQALTSQVDQMNEQRKSEATPSQQSRENRVPPISIHQQIRTPQMIMNERRQRETGRRQQSREDRTPKISFSEMTTNEGPSLQAIRDTEDGVERCPLCQWQLEDGECVQCGLMFDENKEITWRDSLNGFSDMDEMSERDNDDLDHEPQRQAAHRQQSDAVQQPGSRGNTNPFG